jgi:hypothetical protein
MVILVALLGQLQSRGCFKTFDKMKILTSGIGFRRINEIQEIDKRPTIWSKPDSKPSIYAMVVSYNKQVSCH